MLGENHDIFHEFPEYKKKLWDSPKKIRTFAG